MATYPVINKTTGEQKEVVLSVDEWDQWKGENPDWQRAVSYTHLTLPTLYSV